MNNRYENLFNSLDNKNEGAFIPFVTIGDPTKEISLKIIETLIDSGADALELGIPFSDPLADGPTIQNANLRALNSNITPKDCFDIIKQIRVKYPKIPIGLLVYANLVYSNGIEDFYLKCSNSGVDSVLIADVPIHESRDFLKVTNNLNIQQVFIATPDANNDLLKEISLKGSGYTYLLSRVGVTGTESSANMPVNEILDKLKEYNAPKPILGFGISKPEQIKEAIKSGAYGAISGSATVKIIENNLNNIDVMLQELSSFVTIMKKATKL